MAFGLRDGCAVRELVSGQQVTLADGVYSVSLEPSQTVVLAINNPSKPPEESSQPQEESQAPSSAEDSSGQRRRFRQRRCRHRRRPRGPSQRRRLGRPGRRHGPDCSQKKEIKADGLYEWKSQPGGCRINRAHTFGKEDER